MADAWYAAFALLALLGVVNAVLVIAVMRQVGVLHQRIRPTGPGLVGPEPGDSFDELDLSPVPGSTLDGLFQAPVSVVAYVTPGCGLCETLPPFLHAYADTAPDDVKELLGFGFATDASASEAAKFLQEHDLGLPFVRHPRFARHYGISGSPHVLVLKQAESERQVLLGTGVVNTLEQLEDLVDGALARYAGNGSPKQDAVPAGTQSGSPLS